MLVRSDACPATDPAAKTVAVIGAGPAGLVAAKNMLQAGLFPTVFDASRTLGGMWAPGAKRASDNLRTNLSKFACAFSDLAYASGTPMFPARDDVSAYLHGYTDTFLRTGVTLRLGCRVVKAEPTPDGAWRLQAQPVTDADADADADDTAKSRLERGADDACPLPPERFDCLVVATGFFAQPVLPHVAQSCSFSGVSLHSAAYRCADTFANRRVAVVGGSLSAAEIAADLAPVAASVVHITPHPFWVIPRCIPLNARAPAGPWMPLDFVFYRRLLPAPQQEVWCQDDGDGARGAAKHAYMRALTGDFERCLPQALQPTATRPPTVAISDGYTPMLQSGRITLQAGRVTGLDGNTLRLSDGAAVAGIDAVVWCTGYRPDVSFFDGATRRALAWDARDTFMPLVAHRSVFHPDLPNLAFIGMYRGPYFGVMEAQARWAAEVFSGHLPTPARATQEAGMARESALRALRVRPQFPHGDYVGMLDETYAMSNTRPGPDKDLPGKPVVPAQYNRAAPAARATAHAVEETWMQLQAGYGIAEGVFQNLGGLWQLTRRLTSRTPDLPSGTANGTAEFRPDAGRSWHYHEEATFQTPAGDFSTHRAYRYSFDPQTGVLGVFFARGEDAGRSFHDLAFVPPPAGVHPGHVVQARGHHLCGRDTYDVEYAFAFKGAGLTAFTVVYDVRGPAKNYTSSTDFTRPAFIGPQKP